MKLAAQGCDCEHRLAAIGRVGCTRPFFAHFDSTAAWVNDLRPFRSERFFFESEFEELKERASGQLAAQVN